MASTPSVLDVYPASGAQGIPIGDSITVTFDQAMDEDSINTGTFVLTAPDTGVTFGENFSPLDEPGFEDEDILSSPYFGGYVKGTVSFSRVDSSGGLVEDTVVDYTGLGTLWRTVAIFTPTTPLSPNKNYSVLIAGDEDPTNAFDTGVKTRTVFDPEAVAVSGTGILNVGGGYTGSVNRTYSLKILTGGSTGNATYEWWNQADPLTVYQGITTTGLRELQDDIYVTFDPDGTFVVDDEWQFVVVAPVSLPNTYSWSFDTGSGSILTPPSSSSASGIEALAGSSTSTSLTALNVSDISPDEGEYGVAISESAYTGEIITITFSADIDTTTLTDNISIRAESANGDTSVSSTGDLTFTSSLSGAVLTITLDPGQLYVNNIIVITIDKDVADTDGYTLGTDYVSYFSTTYTPLYSSLRRIQLDLGPALTNIATETIMFAIYEASLHADAITFITNISNATFFNRAKREFVTCLAELTLIKAIMSDGSADRMSKSLGELSVSRSGDSALMGTKADLEDCVSYWKVVVETGGEISPDTSLKPEYSVKGANADDAIMVNRQWEPVSGYGGNVPSANTRVDKNNTSFSTSSRKGFRTRRKRY